MCFLIDSTDLNICVLSCTAKMKYTLHNCFLGICCASASIGYPRMEARPGGGISRIAGIHTTPYNTIPCHTIHTIPQHTLPYNTFGIRIYTTPFLIQYITLTLGKGFIGYLSNCYRFHRSPTLARQCIVKYFLVCQHRKLQT